jgi:hypothetical protein
MAFICAMGLSLSAASATAPPQGDELSQIAREAVSELSGANYAAFYARFDETMKTAMPAGKLQEVWGAVTSQAGAFKSQGETWSEKSGPFDVVFVTCQFDKTPLSIRLVFNSKRQIAGRLNCPA